MHLLSKYLRLLETFDKESCLGVRRGGFEDDLSLNLVLSEGKREDFFKSNFSEYLTGEVTAGMNYYHL